MGAQIRVYRQKFASTSSMKKIFKAMELIAASRIQKAIARSQGVDETIIDAFDRQQSFSSYLVSPA